MPLQNRVTPLGELVPGPGRGLVFGNRGRLHDAAGRIRRPYDGKRWIACRLSFRGRKRPLMEPGRYTALFFLDEATALAAGHRPCAECRHEDYVRFSAIWSRLHAGEGTAGAIDARLHAERLRPHRAAAIDELPDGAFVLFRGVPHVVCWDRLLRWSPGGYAEAVTPRGSATAPVITPPSLIEVLRTGWSSSVPLLHPSALTPSKGSP